MAGKFNLTSNAAKRWWWWCSRGSWPSGFGGRWSSLLCAMSQAQNRSQGESTIVLFLRFKPNDRSLSAEVDGRIWSGAWRSFNCLLLVVCFVLDLIHSTFSFEWLHFRVTVRASPRSPSCLLSLINPVGVVWPSSLFYFFLFCLVSCWHGQSALRYCHDFFPTHGPGSLWLTRSGAAQR